MANSLWMHLAFVALLYVTAGARGAAGGDTTLSGPVLGIVFDPANRGLRPIYGLPGAATLGQALDLGIPIAQAVVSAQQNRALAVAADDARVVSIQLSMPPTIDPVEGALPGPQTMVWSPSGNAAALYQRESSRIQVFNGMDGTPALAGEIDTAALPGSLTAMAVADDGTTVLAAFSDENAGSVLSFSGDGHMKVALVVHRASAIRFLNGSSDAVIADDQDNKVFLVRDTAGEAAMIQLAGTGDGIAGPSGVNLSADNARVFAANSQSGTIAVMDAAGGPVTTIPCGCTPAGLHRMNGNAIFRLTEISGGPLWVLDADAAEPRVFFVPAEPARDSDAAGESPRAKLALQ